MTPKELVEQEKQRLKQSIMDAVVKFVEDTGIDVDNIEIYKLSMHDHPIRIALTINLSKMQ